METTINMRQDIYERLCELSEQHKMLRSDLVKYVLNKIATKELLLEQYGATVAYQKEAKQWHKFHIAFDGAEFERNADLRKLFKMSLSLLFAFGLEFFGEDIFSNNWEKPKTEPIIFADIYRPLDYLFCSFSDNYHRMFTFIWYKRQKT